MNPSERGESDPARPSPPAARGRPSLERPSLFAGMEGQPATTTSAPGVRILSTLESQQRLPPRRRVIEGEGARPRGSRPRRSALGRLVLWSLLGAGIALAVGGMWLSAEQAESAPRDVARTPVAAIASTRAASPVAPAPAPSAVTAASAVADAPLAALIENTAPAAPAPAPTQESPLKTLQEAPAAPSVIQVARVPAVVVSAPSPQATRAEAAPKSRPQTEARRARPAPDNDVALLQAMFEHSSRSPTTPRSAGQELARQCGPLSGDEARACRTRVCRKFPQAKVCR